MVEGVGEIDGWRGCRILFTIPTHPLTPSQPGREDCSPRPEWSHRNRGIWGWGSARSLTGLIVESAEIPLLHFVTIGKSNKRNPDSLMDGKPANNVGSAAITGPESSSG
jgi:hypothetical protein